MAKSKKQRERDRLKKREKRQGKHHDDVSLRNQSEESVIPLPVSHIQGVDEEREEDVDGTEAPVEFQVGEGERIDAAVPTLEPLAEEEPEGDVSQDGEFREERTIADLTREAGEAPPREEHLEEDTREEILPESPEEGFEPEKRYHAIIGDEEPPLQDEGIKTENHSGVVRHESREVPAKYPCCNAPAVVSKWPGTYKGERVVRTFLHPCNCGGPGGFGFSDPPLQ